MAPPKSPIPLVLRLAVVLVIMAALWYARRAGPPPQPDARPVRPATVHVVDGTEVGHPAESEAVHSAPRTAERTIQTENAGDHGSNSAPRADQSLLITNLKLRDESGRVIYEGNIDLQQTLDRVAAGELLERFRNDGSTFQNRERRLPRQPSGYYKEFVVPTPGERGPGPQRVIVGKEDEVFYTSDHYKTFRRIR